MLKLILILISFFSSPIYAQMPALPSKLFLNELTQFRENPTPQAYDKFLNKTRISSHQFLIRYNYAYIKRKQDPKKACLIFSKLAREENFEFKNIAYIRAFEVCQSPLPTKKWSASPWLNKAFDDIRLKKCKLKSTNDCVETLIRKSKESLPYSEKVNFIELALKKARVLKNKRLIHLCEQRLIKIAPRFLKKKRPSDFLKVANDYRKNREFKQAKVFYDKIIGGNFSTRTKIKAYRALSKSYKLQRKYKKYVHELEKLHSFILHIRKINRRSISLKQINKSSLEYARATWTYVSRSQAEKTLAGAIKILNKKYSLAEIYWVLARISEEKLNYKSAIWWLKKALKEKSKNLELKDKIYWHLAWNEKKLKRFKDSIRSLQKLSQLTENQFSRAKYQFWIAKTHFDLNQKSQAKQIFEKLIEEAPMSYYSLLAHKFLGKKISYSKKSDQEIKIDSTLYQKLKLLSVDWLLLLQEKEIAKDFLKLNVKKHRAKFNEEDFKTIFHYYAKTELYLEFFYLMSIQSPERQISLLAKNPQFLFPQPYKSIVEKNTTEFNFDPNIVYSIMRQESAFNPQARSFADAFGLLQLIPKVAIKAKKSIAVDYKEVNDLFNPEVNIRLGAFYLKSLWQKYNQSFILATASYNATEKAIASWLKTRYKGDTLEFIEDVPYEETRNYIKLVMRNYIFYKLINSPGSINFPEHCLEIGKSNL